MSEKRKQIFREGLFVVPFMIIVTAVSLIMMFLVGRTPADVVGSVNRNIKSDQSMNIASYTQINKPKYTLYYYYGDDSSSVKFAEFEYNAKGDNPLSSLTLFEARDGFDAGHYKIEWLHAEEYVTYATLDNENETENYPAEEVPLMYNIIKSYSWQNQLESFGVEYEPSKGYKLLGFVSLYTWDSDNRRNILWGIGGNPLVFYSYLGSGSSEYKKVSFTKWQ